MPTSPLLGLPQLAANQSQKELTINSAIEGLEQAMAMTLALSYATVSTITLSATQATRNMTFIGSGATNISELVFPALINGFPINRVVSVRNLSNWPMTVRSTSTDDGDFVNIPRNRTWLLSIESTVVRVIARNELSLPADSPSNYRGEFGDTSFYVDFESGAFEDDFLVFTSDYFADPGGTIVAKPDPFLGLTKALKLDSFPGGLGDLYTQVQWEVAATESDNTLNIRFLPDVTGAGGAGGVYIYVDGAVVQSFGGGTAWLDASVNLSMGTHTVAIRAQKGYPSNTGALYISRFSVPGLGGRYIYGDTVRYNGEFYFCMLTGTTEEPGTGINWYRLISSLDILPDLSTNGGKILAVTDDETGVKWVESSDGTGGGKALPYATVLSQQSLETNLALGDEVVFPIPVNAGKYRLIIELPAVASINPQFVLYDQSDVAVPLISHRWSSEGTTDNVADVLMLALTAGTYINNRRAYLSVDFDKQVDGRWRVSGCVRGGQIEGQFFGYSNSTLDFAKIGTTSTVGAGYPAGTTFRFEQINEHSVGASGGSGGIGSLWSVEGTGTGASQQLVLPEVPGSGSAILVFVNGLRYLTSEYVIAGNLLTLTTNHSGDLIEVVALASTLAVPDIAEIVADHTLTGDEQYVRVISATPVEITIPPESELSMIDGYKWSGVQAGAGQVTFVPGVGVTLNTPETLSTRKQFSPFQFIKVGTNVWDVSGDLEVI